jgi:mannonate dehydratase
MGVLPNARRRHLLLGGLGLVGLTASALAARHSPVLLNACRAALPPDLADHPLIHSAWVGLDPNQVWDAHTHLVGTGDSGSGVVVNPQMESLLHPLQYAQRLFYLNAGCVHEAPPGQVDQAYVERLHNLMAGFPVGAKILLFAFDRFHDEAGRPVPERSTFYVPDSYAARIAREFPAGFEWAASIHPYRADCVAALDSAVAAGARAVKWLPAAMGIDPSSPRCDAFYAALVRHDLPLITHAGEEKAVHGGDTQHFGNPLRLRRPMDQGVRVVVAHCASLGVDVDTDRGSKASRVPSFSLFARLMGDPAYERLLHADISALTLRNRQESVLRALLEKEAWHHRLLNGSDYPLPGIVPLVLPKEFSARGMLASKAVPVLTRLREHNPLLFDFVLKRHLHSRGRRFADRVFQTRAFFDRKPS